MKHRWQSLKPGGFIYITQALQWHKIGRTWNLSKRLAQLCLTPPFPTSLIHAFGCDNVRRAEEILHDVHSEMRVAGEWYLLDDFHLALLLSFSEFSNGMFRLGDQKNNAVYQEGIMAAEMSQRENAKAILNPFDPAYPCYGVWQRGYNNYCHFIEHAEARP